MAHTIILKRRATSTRIQLGKETPQTTWEFGQTSEAIQYLLEFSLIVSFSSFICLYQLDYFYHAASPHGISLHMAEPFHQQMALLHSRPRQHLSRNQAIPISHKATI